MTLECPYCDHENEDPEIEDLDEEETDYSTCENCSRHFSYSYRTSLDFGVDKMEEDLESCKIVLSYTKDSIKLYESRLEKADKDDQEQINFEIKSAQNRKERQQRKLDDIEEMIEENKKIGGEDES